MMPGLRFVFGILRTAATRPPVDVSALDAALALWRLTPAWTGPLVTVRRDSDNATLEVPATASGRLDTASLLAWCGAASAFVALWWDQTGNARHAGQTTPALQPRLVNAGALQTHAGYPVLSFSGGNQHLTVANSLDFARGRAAVTLAAAFARSVDTGAGQTLLHAKTAGGSTRAALVLEPDGTGYLNTLGGRHPDSASYAHISAGPNPTGTWTRLVGRLRAGAAQADIAVDGTTTTAPHLTGAVFSDAAASAAVTIGSTGAGALSFSGSMAAVALAQSATDIAATDLLLSEDFALGEAALDYLLNASLPASSFSTGS